MNTFDGSGAQAKLDASTTVAFALGRSRTARRRVPSELRVGSIFGDERYELLDVIGIGGTSVVHEVYDRVLDRKLAGKFMLPDQGDRVAEIAQLEGKAMARLSHPNVITIHDVGMYGNTPFLLMELLEGRPLADVLACHRLSPRRAIDVVLAVAAGLEHAHRRGVLHLDLKPGNVHVTHDGMVKLLDFGVGSRHLTLANGDEPSIVGTPCYMAPEQWNFGPLDPRTDIWALGLLLYECLSGHLPCEGQHPGFASSSGRGFAVPALSSLLCLPSSMDSVIQRALSADPTLRQQTIGEFVMMLDMVQLQSSDLDIGGCESHLARISDGSELKIDCSQWYLRSTALERRGGGDRPRTSGAC